MHMREGVGIYFVHFTKLNILSPRFTFRAKCVIIIEMRGGKMEKEPLTQKQEEYIEKMVKHLPVLRTSIRITQKDLAKKIGVTRQSMMLIETRRRPLQWSTYLALVFVFQQFDDTKILIDSLEIYDAEILRQLK